MYTAIKNYCENEQQNGLFLMDMPTGYGKTYNVIKYIFDASTAPENKNRRYFFITMLKKNLPIKELEQWFIKAGKEEQFKEKFLFIDSNVDCVIEHFTAEVKNEIPYDIKKPMNTSSIRILSNFCKMIMNNYKKLQVQEVLKTIFAARQNRLSEICSRQGS